MSLSYMSPLVKCYSIQPHGSKRWVVLGTAKEYLVTLYSCTCRDFMSKTLKKDDKKCKHIIALQEALQKGEFDMYTISTQEYKELRPYLLEIKK